MLQVLKSYAESIKLGYRHIYQSLPRLLTLWYDFGTQLQALSPQAQVPIGCLTAWLVFKTLRQARCHSMLLFRLFQ